MNYMMAIGLALRFPTLFSRWAMAGGHALLATLLVWKTVRLDAAGYSQQGIKDYYSAIWWVGEEGWVFGGAGGVVQQPCTPDAPGLAWVGRSGSQECDAGRLFRRLSQQITLHARPPISHVQAQLLLRVPAAALPGGLRHTVSALPFLAAEALPGSLRRVPAALV